jgi:GNAT superfamily N-acetyltransferase
MSKRKSEGYQRKLKWLRDRFDEGLKIKMLDLRQGGRGFIEYIPGEFAWRAVNAEGYMFVHCIWVAGKSKGQGYATLLLNECMKDAEKTEMQGIAALASEGNWLVGKKFFQKQDFKPVAEHPPFTLMVKKFTDAQSPSFSGDFNTRLTAHKKGLTILRSDQCPYIDAAVGAALDAASELGITAKVIELKSSEDVRKFSPSPYGVFALVYKGRLASYHSISKKDLVDTLGG